MKKLFTQHPESIGESYGQHFQAAFPCGAKLFFAGLACMVHSILPFLFVNTASDVVKRIHNKMQSRQTAGQSQQN